MSAVFNRLRRHFPEEQVDHMPRVLKFRTWMRPFLLVVAASCLLSLPLNPAQAQLCNYSIDNVNFGSITPIDNQDILAQTTFHAT